MASKSVRLPDKFYLTEGESTIETSIEHIIRAIADAGSGEVFTAEYDDGNVKCTEFYFSCDK